MQVVGERHAWPDKNIVLQRDAFPNMNAAFDGNTMAKAHTFFKKGVIAQIAVFAHDRPGANMGKGPDPGAIANNRARINERLRMNFQDRNDIRLELQTKPKCLNANEKNLRANMGLTQIPK
jgi:hypothetical protein